MDNLDGKVAIVTGGGRGLGKIMAQHLAAAGAKVAVIGRSAAHLNQTVEAIQSAGGRAMSCVADVTDRAAVERLVPEVEQQLGPVDLLVNNAGVVDAIGPVAEVDPDQWWHIMQVNVYGAFLCARAVLPTMLRRKQGCIINIASGAALGPIANGTSYCTSKAALVRFTDCLAAEVKNNSIAVFAVDPGTVKTDMTHYLVNSDEGKKWVGWFADIFTQNRDVPPEKSAELVVSLASGQAHSLTGCFISVEHNLPEMIEQADQIQRDDLYTLRLRT